MRGLFALLAVSGLAGVVFGILTIVSGTQDGVPFSHEHYGGPGAVIGGAVLTAVSLYLLLNWGKFDSSSDATHHG